MTRRGLTNFFEPFQKAECSKLLPGDGQVPVFDVWLDSRLPGAGVEGDFRPWDDIVQEFKYDARQQFFDMVVPTSDTTRFAHIMELLIRDAGVSF